MNKEQYNALPDDLKLDARLAITLGEEVVISDDPDNPNELCYKNSSKYRYSDWWRPRQDPAILWGLVNDFTCFRISRGLPFVTRNDSIAISKTKEEALIIAYCAADPHGHWAKWCEENEVSI